MEHQVKFEVEKVTFEDNTTLFLPFITEMEFSNDRNKETRYVIYLVEDKIHRYETFNKKLGRISIRKFGVESEVFAKELIKLYRKQFPQIIDIEIVHTQTLRDNGKK